MSFQMLLSNSVNLSDLKRVMIKYFVIVFLFTSLIACSSQNELSPEEILIQKKATDALTEILFEHGLDENSSFKVEKTGHVNLRVEGLVSVDNYKNTISEIKNHEDITGLMAALGSKEICPLTIIVR